MKPNIAYQTFAPLSLNAVQTAADVNLKKREQLQNLWNMYMNAKLTRKGQQDANRAARKQNELGWASIGTNTLSSFIGPGSIGAGLVANAINAPYQNRLLEMLEQSQQEQIPSLANMGIPFDDLLDYQLQSIARMPKFSPRQFTS